MNGKTTNDISYECRFGRKPEPPPEITIPDHQSEASESSTKQKNTRTYSSVVAPPPLPSDSQSFPLPSPITTPSPSPVAPVASYPYYYYYVPAVPMNPYQNQLLQAIPPTTQQYYYNLMSHQMSQYTNYQALQQMGMYYPVSTYPPIPSQSHSHSSGYSSSHDIRSNEERDQTEGKDEAAHSCTDSDGFTTVPSAPTATKPRVPPNPLEQVEEILYQMSFHTFDRTVEKILSLPLTNTSMVERLVDLIYEKAISSPSNWTDLFVDLCVKIKEKSEWDFVTVVHSPETHDCFWIRDLDFPDITKCKDIVDQNIAGPFASEEDGLAIIFMVIDAKNDQENPSKEFNFLSSSSDSFQDNNKPELIQLKIISMNNYLLKIMMNLLTEEYYIHWLSLDEIPEEQISAVNYDSEKEAIREAHSFLSFHGLLVGKCEKEFQRALSSTELKEMEKGKSEFLNDPEIKKKKYSEMFAKDEIQIQKDQIQSKIKHFKASLLRNMQFIGELFKKRLLNIDIMFDCFHALLGEPIISNSSFEEINLELFASLLETIGNYLETELKADGLNDHFKKFDIYFGKLAMFTQEKKLSSEVRVKLQSLIKLRENSWDNRWRK
jgi:hypothetical protein